MPMEENTDEFEPLFDYSRSQPINIFIEDDDDDVVPLSFFGEKRKRRCYNDLENETTKKVQKVVINEESNNNDKESKDNKEEDWMPLPPPLTSKSGGRIEEDKILQEIRLSKQELASIVLSKDVIDTVVESVKKERRSSLKDAIVLDVDEPSKPAREKILISIQDKDGQKPFRMYMDDKLEKLFKMYANKVNLKFESLVFCFDGEKLMPSSTPSSAGLENDDIIEVHMKSS